MKGFKSALDNFGKFINQFQPETKTLIRKLERILIKSYKQNVSLLFNQTRARTHTHTHTHTYISTYICICMCVDIYIYLCVYEFLDLYIYIYHHHHHDHLVLVPRISLTLSRHSSLSFIAPGRSSGQHPVSSHSC